MDDEQKEQIINNRLRDSLALRMTLDPRISEQNETKILKKKLQVLKDAIIKERDVKADLEKKINELKQKIEQSQKQTDNLEQTIIKQKQEIQNLQELLIVERINKDKYIDLYMKLKTQLYNNQSQNPNSEQISESNFFGEIASMFGFKKGTQIIEEYQKVLKENALLKDQIEKSKTEIKTLLTKENSLEKQNQELKEILNQKNQIEQTLRENLKKNEEIFTKSEERILQIEQIIKSNEEAYKKTKQTQENEIKTLKEENEKIKLEEILKRQNLEQNNKDLKENMKKAEENLINMEKKLAFFEESIMIFNLQKLNQNLNRFNPCQIICRKDFEGQHIIDIDSLDDKFSVNATELQDAMIEFDPQQQLTLMFKKAKSLIFVSGGGGGGNDLNYIHTKIQNFMIHAPNYKPQRNIQEQSKKDQKGLMGNLYSFLKN